MTRPSSFICSASSSKVDGTLQALEDYLRATEAGHDRSIEFEQMREAVSHSNRDSRAGGIDDVIFIYWRNIRFFLINVDNDASEAVAGVHLGYRALEDGKSRHVESFKE